MDPEEVKNRLSRLTQREREILQAFCEGLKYFQIAQRFNLGDGTVRVYMYHVSHKLELENYSKTERRRILLNIFCEALKSGELPEPSTDEEPVELVRLTPEEEEEIEDLQYEIINVDSAEIVGPPPPPRRGGCRTFSFGLLAGAFLMALAGIGIYWMWMTFAPSLIGEPVLESPIAQATESTSFATVTHTQEATEPVVVEDTPYPSATVEMLPSPTTVVLTSTEIPSIPLPFMDNFDNGPSTSWKVLNGDWLTANGRYTILGEGYDFKWSILDETSWENYRVSVNMEIANHRSGAQGIIAIAVRIQHNKPQYIGFYINSITYGGWALIGTDRHDTEFIADYGPVIPETSNLVLEVNGNQFTAYLDGRVYQQINFPGYERGGVALGIGCNFSSCTSFDDFSVESIDP